MRKVRFRRILQPITNLLLHLNLSPNLLTLLSLLFALFAFYLFRRGYFRLGGIPLIIISLLDTLDGELARQKNVVSAKGAFLDSVVDRFTEFFIFFGLFLYYSEEKLKILVFLTFATSFSVSYVRARAEGIGRSCRIGLFERPVRFFFLIIAALFFPHYFPHFLLIIFLGALFTTFQRIIYIWRG